MRDTALVSRLEAIEEGEAVLHMDEEAFRAFYDRTARQVWAYLSRLTGSPQAADDLLQEAYYRLLRADRAFESDDHRRNYLFRIATNLVRDGHRRPGRGVVASLDEPGANALSNPGDEADLAARRADLSRALARLKPRERSLIWLAYAHGSSHVEIAESLGVRTSSVKALLFRARRRLAALLEGKGPS